MNRSHFKELFFLLKGVCNFGSSRQMHHPLASISSHVVTDTYMIHICMSYTLIIFHEIF